MILNLNFQMGQINFKKWIYLLFVTSSFLVLATDSTSIDSLDIKNSISQRFRRGSNGDCTTPKDVQGKCIVLLSCKSLLAMLQPPVEQESLRFLQMSTCDSSGSEPKVCCPLSELPTVRTTTTTTTARPTTARTIPTVRTTTSKPQASGENDVKNIANHRNANLLPNSTECGKSLLLDRIAHGQNAGLGSFPWMVLIGYSLNVKNTPIQFACGGTIINSKYVLTAAHCVTKLPDGFKPTVVRLGEYDQSSDIDCEGSICAPKSQDIEVDEIIPHEKYDQTDKKENDIALVRLKHSAALGPFVAPICLPHGETLRKSSHMPIVAGWGRLTSGNPENANILQEVSVPFVPMEKCNAVYKEVLGKEVDEGRFCAGGKDGKDSCQGDSGGPLMLALPAKNVNWKLRAFQFGVVSLGPKNCESAGLPALYTKVPYFMPWILDHLRP